MTYAASYLRLFCNAVCVCPEVGFVANGEAPAFLFPFGTVEPVAVAYGFASPAALSELFHACC